MLSQSRIRFRRPELIPALFMACAVAVLFSLGVWQLQRLSWKEGLIAQYTAAKVAPALTALPADANGLEYRHAQLTGEYLYAHTYLKAGALAGKGPGFFLLTPLKLTNNSAILVNRGFVAGDKKAVALVQAKAPEGQAEAEGILREPMVKRFFTPLNKPEQNLWFYEDLTAMGRAANVTLYPLVLEATKVPASEPKLIVNRGEIRLRNDHLGYAITWFALAIAGAVMFALYHRERIEGTGA